LNGNVSKKYTAKGILTVKPDIVLAGFKAFIFVHGCFWHRHENCKDTTVPKILWSVCGRAENQNRIGKHLIH
jgi:G:T-mismatch repair DNA endonuclease (very short patch repair protein)